MTRVLRPYQLEAVTAVRDEWSKVTRTAVVLPTGCGKTDVIADLAVTEARAGGRTLVLAHRGELLDQITERCGMHAPDIAVGRVQAGRNQTRRPITVAMAPTLASAKRRAQLPLPTLVVVDECHHAASPSFIDTLTWAGCFEGTPTVGVTATLVRGDRRGLGDVWESVAYSRDIAWAIGEGWLVAPRGRVVVGEHVKLNEAKVSRGDYQDGELGDMVSQDVDQIVKAWLEHASDRITVAFTPNVSSAQTLAEEFRAQGVAVGEVYGTTPPTERAATYAALAAGELRVLVSVMVTTEGWDCPPVSCILMARPTRLPGLYQQIVGRGLRPSPGKSDCLVLDVVGASRSQRLVTLIDLHPTAEINRDELDVLPCEDCGGFMPAAVKARPWLEACTCEVAPAERDPDGGRTRLRGPATYADVDLLGLTGSGLNWLETRAGVPFVKAGDRYGVLWAEGGDLWSAGHCHARRTVGVWIIEHVDLEAARAAIEVWAGELEADLRDQPWRVARKRATPGQVKLATRLGIAAAESYTSGAISNEIDIVLASRRLDR